MFPLILSSLATVLMAIALYRAAMRVSSAKMTGIWHFWRILVGFIIGFFIAYLLYTYQIYAGFVQEGSSGMVASIFLAGSAFVLLCVELMSSGVKLDGRNGSETSALPSLPFEPKAAWIIFGGTLASLICGFFVLQTLRSQWREAFHIEIEAETYDLSNRILRSNEALESARGLFLANHQVTKAQFETFTRPMIKTHTYIKAIEWVPRVYADGRSAFEKMGRVDGDASFQITERNSAGEIVVAGSREQYFPVSYVEPTSGNELARGYDLGSEPVRREALLKSMLSGSIIASGSLQLVQDQKSTPSFLVFEPIFKNNNPNPNEREVWLRGFVLGVYHVEALFESLLQGHLSKGLSLSVLDATDGESTRLFGTTPTSSMLRKEFPLKVFGRDWIFVWEATSEYRGGPGGGIALLSAILVFFISAVLAFWFELLAQRGRDAVSEERDRFFDLAVDLICIAGFDGYFKKLSPSWERLLGFTREELYAKPYIEFVHPDDRERTLNENISVVGGIAAIRFENRYQKKDGGWCWLSWNATPNADENLIYATVRDVTDLKTTQDQLEMSRERFDLSVQGSNDGIWDWDLRTNKVYFSDRWKTMLGYTPDEIEDGFEAWSDLIHPDDREGALNYVQTYLDGKIEKYEREIRMRCKDGEYRWILTRGAAVRDENGKALRLSGAHTDISERKQAERDQFESEERFRGLFNNAEVSIWNEDFSELYAALEALRDEGITDLRQYLDDHESALSELVKMVKVRQVNAATLSLFGGKDQEDLLIQIDKTFGPEALVVFENELLAIWDKKREFKAETQFRSLDGEVIHAVISLQIPNTKEGFKSIPVSIVDITERKAAEAGLVKNEEKFRKVFDNSRDGMLTANEETRSFTMVNKAICEMLGYSEEELLSKSVSDIHPEEALPFVVDTFKKQVAGEFQLAKDIPVKRKDGSVFFAEINSSLININGEELLLGAFRDMTQRKRDAENLQRALGRLEAVLNTPGDVVIAWIDKDGIFRGWGGGADRILGWTAEEVVGKKGPEIIHDLEEVQQRCETLSKELGRDIKPGYDMFLEFARDPKRRDAEWTLVRKDGSKYRAQLFLSPLQDPSDNQDMIMGISIDVSKRHELEVALREARDQAIGLANAKSEFLANMSHEIRTPMNGVVGMANLLLETNVDAEQQDYAETIRVSADSLLSIINDILDFSKVETGKLVLESVDFDLTNCVEDVAQLLMVSAGIKKLELACFVDPKIPTLVRGDAGRLRQVLVNLIGNAIKFTENGDISIRVLSAAGKGDANRVRFEVHDTGLGISSKDQKNLFDAFTQADSSMSRRFGGTGLGLAISNSIVSTMGGKIGVESEEGRGSLFWFEIDLEIAKTFIEKSGDERLKGKRVLILDDNPVSLEILDGYLRHWGMNPTLVENSDEARASFARSIEDEDPFSLVILDMGLAEGGSVDQLHWFHALSEDRPKLLLLSEMGRAGRTAAVDAGADRFLTKPIRQSHLAEAIMALLFDETTSSIKVDTGDIEAGSESSLRRLLVAEDNPVNQKVITTMLERIGYKVDVVGNGKEAVEAVREGNYALVLMDCQMPELNGYDATRQIRQLDGDSGRTPIIGITAHAMEGDRQKVLDAGMDEYLAKPILIQDLRSAIKKKIKPDDVDVILDMKVIKALEGLDDGKGDALRDLVKTFLRDASKRVDSIRNDVDAGKLSYRETVHTIKGSSSSLGAQLIKTACVAMERDLEKGGNRAKELASELESAFAVSRDALRRVAGLS